MAGTRKGKGQKASGDVKEAPTTTTTTPTTATAAGTAATATATAATASAATPPITPATTATTATGSTTTSTTTSTTASTTTSTPTTTTVPPTPEASDSDKLAAAATEMFDNLGAYASGELLATIDDYKVLRKLNDASAHKYAAMTTSATHMSKDMEKLQEEFTRLAPYLDKLDDVDASVEQLERSVEYLDEYTRKLESEFASLPPA